MRSNRFVSLALALGIGAALAGCGGDAPAPTGASTGTGAGEDAGALAGASLIVGSKEFTESVLLGKITQLALEDAGATVTDKTGISGSATVRTALESREIDMYWDYTGTGWVNILKHTTTDLPADLHQAVAKEDGEKNGVAWLPPAPFENSYAIAVKKDFADANGLTTMSQAVDHLKANPADSTVCAASEFLNRDDGLPGLHEAYDFRFAKVNELEFNLIFTQIGESCPFGEVTTTDGRILANGLTVLEDDKDFFLEYRGALTLRQETLTRYPAIADVIRPINDKLTDEALTELNSKIDVDAEEPADVAQDWLESQGLID